MDTDLNKSIVIMTGVYSGEFNIEIVLNDHGKAKTNGQTIFIPKPKPEYLEITWGYCAHEAAHCRYTDFSWFKRAFAQSKLLHRTLNIIEDTRIEILFVHVFPGTRRYFKALAEQVLKFHRDKALNGLDPDDPSVVGKLLDIYFMHYVRGKLTKYPNWDETMLAIETYLYETLGTGFMDGFAALLDRAVEVSSTEKAYYLAEDVLTYVEDHAINQTGTDGITPPQDYDDDSDDNTESDDTAGGDSGSEESEDDSSEGDSSGSDESDDNTESDDTAGGNSGSEESEDDSSEGESSGSDESEDNTESESAHILNGFLNEQGDADTGELASEILSQPENQEALSELERACAPSKDSVIPKMGKAMIEQFENMAVQSSSSLQRSLVRLLQDKTRTQRVTTKRGRRVAKGKCHRLTIGDTRIFKRKFQEREEVSCDLVVLADSSSSLTDGQIAQIKVATYSLLSCLSRIDGASTSAYSFCDHGDVYILKSPQESFSNHVRSRIAALSPSGFTPATEAYWVAAQDLFRMNGAKKVVVMITDGEPDNHHTTKEIVDLLRQNGVVVLCIAVGKAFNGGGSTLDYCYGAGQWLKVPSFKDLCSELLRVTKEVI